MKYSPQKIKECAEWVEVHGLQDFGGAMLKDFCDAMDIEDETFYQWMKKAEFSEAILKAKEVFRGSLEKRIVESMANNAMGYDYEETRTEYKQGLLGKSEIKSKTVTKKHVAPNTAAGIFLLTNINPDKWKNKLNQENSGRVTVVQKPLTDEELRELHKRLDDV